MSLKIVPTIGCDPEVFVKVDGKFVNPFDLTKGSKDKPEKIDGGAVQIDGMALEFNIDPAKDYKTFIENIKKVRSHLGSVVSGRYGDSGSLWAVPVAEFDPDYLFSQPKENLELGCNADYNAYTGAANPRPNANKPFRTGAGHVHIGWAQDGEKFDVEDPEHIEACQMMTKQLDCSLGILFSLFEKDTRRRELYGDFGAFRPKPYGVEYRTLSNIWLINERFIQIVFDVSQQSFQDLMKGKQYYEYNLFHNIMNEIRTKDIHNPESRNAIVKAYQSACGRVGITCYYDYVESLFSIINKDKAA